MLRKTAKQRSIKSTNPISRFCALEHFLRFNVNILDYPCYGDAPLYPPRKYLRKYIETVLYDLLYMMTNKLVTN